MTDMQCNATTKKGTPCKNKAIRESGFCRTHQKETPTPIDDQESEGTDDSSMKIIAVASLVGVYTVYVLGSLFVAGFLAGMVGNIAEATQGVDQVNMVKWFGMGWLFFIAPLMIIYHNPWSLPLVVFILYAWLISD